MPLTDLLSPAFVNDINTAGNVTSAGIAIAALNVANENLSVTKEALTVARQTLAILEADHKKDAENQLLQTRILTAILEQLKILNKTIKEDNNA